MSRDVTRANLAHEVGKPGLALVTGDEVDATLGANGGSPPAGTTGFWASQSYATRLRPHLTEEPHVKCPWSRERQWVENAERTHPEEPPPRWARQHTQCRVRSWFPGQSWYCPSAMLESVLVLLWSPTVSRLRASILEPHCPRRPRQALEQGWENDSDTPLDREWNGH